MAQPKRLITRLSRHAAHFISAAYTSRMAGNSPFYSHGCKSPLPVAEGVAGKPGCKTSGRNSNFRYSSQGCGEMTLYGYARVSVREPEDKNLDLQVERLVRAGCLHGQC